MAPTPPEDPRLDEYPGEELSPFDVRDYSDRRSMRLLIITLVLILLVAIVAFRLYYSGTRDRDAPPRISANETPIKVSPDDPGGEVVPDQDKVVYDVMNGDVQSETVTARTEPETPVERPAAANIVVKDPARPVIEEPAPEVTTAPTAAEPTTPPVSAAIGPYVVQVASVRTPEAAQDMWNKINRNYGAIFPTGTRSDIRRVDLPGKGIYYRLRIAGLSGKPAADGLCAQLKAQGQACFVTPA